jgi:uncharacterized protein (DUF2141 family)
MILQTIIFFSSLLCIMQPTNVQPTLKLEISGLKNNKGFVLIAIFNSTLGFPDKKELAVKKIRIPAQTGSFTYEVHDLVPGTYALALIHDENDNQRLDTGLFGIPKEGFCFSRGAMGTFGPLSFQAASFVPKSSSKVLVIRIELYIRNTFQIHEKTSTYYPYRINFRSNIFSSYH